jgi:hypothetical protein
MQFLVYDPNPNLEASAPPSPEMMAEMGTFIEEATRAAVIQVNSLEEAIEWSKRFRQIVGDGESEIVQVFGPDDFGSA